MKGPEMSQVDRAAELEDEMATLRNALRWVGEVYPGKTRDGGAIDSEDTTQPPPLLRDIRESASIASIKGEVVLTNRTG